MTREELELKFVRVNEPPDYRTLSIKQWIARQHLARNLKKAHKIGCGLGEAPYHEVNIELEYPADD